MGIVNIHILVDPEITRIYTVPQVTQVQALQQALVYAHRRGEHPYGSMRRDCPLCQLGK